MRTSVRRIARCVAVAFAGVFALTTAAPAQADALDVTCTGTVSTTLSPGLTLTPQSITTTNNFVYNPCTSTDPNLSSGQYSLTFTAVFSCLSPMDSGSGTKRILWNTGQFSDFAFNSTTSTVGGQFVVVRTGVITGGQFQGNTAVETTVGPSLDLLACAVPPGITSRSSVTTLEITSL